MEAPPSHPIPSRPIPRVLSPGKLVTNPFPWLSSHRSRQRPPTAPVPQDGAASCKPPPGAAGPGRARSSTAAPWPSG